MNYAKTRSDVVAKMRGTFDEEVKAKRETRRLKELSKYKAYINKLFSFANYALKYSKLLILICLITEQRQLKAKKKIIDKFLKMRSDNEEMLSSKIQSTSKPGGFQIDGQESNNLLFIEGLSKRTSTALLNEIFSQAVVSGFKEVRHIVEKEVAFVEYEDDHTAAIAMNALQGYQLKESNGETTILSISFAKR